MALVSALSFAGLPISCVTAIPQEAHRLRFWKRTVDRVRGGPASREGPAARQCVGAAFVSAFFQ